MSLGLNGSSAGAGVGPVVRTWNGTGKAVTLEFDSPPKMIIFRAEDTSMQRVAFWEANGTNALLYSVQKRNNNMSGNANVTGITLNGNTVRVNAAELLYTGYTYNCIAFF